MSKTHMTSKSKTQLLEERRVTTPVIANVSMPLPNTQYTYAPPTGCKALQWQNRAANDVRYAWTTGVVASPAPTLPYFTLKSGAVWYNDYLSITSATLHVATAASVQMVEIETWT
ncbi:MAG: hypothetical protein H8D74_01245 [Chloroflexi bacterium]|nr:hypothetical protein [Chloroflexota bacterium]